MTTTTTKRERINRRPSAYPDTATCRVPAGVLDRIAACAEREGTWPSEWTRKALMDALRRSERRAERERAGA